MARHGRDAVVEHDRRHRRAVVVRAQDAGDAAVEERGVTEHRADAALLPGLLHAGGIADGGAHADRRVHRVEGRECAERVAADVARHGGAELGERVEDAAVAAARAENRRTRRQRGVRLHDLRLRDVLQQLMAEVLQAIGIQLHHVELGLVALHLDAERLDLVLEERVEFLDHKHVAHRLRELLHEVRRERVRPAELQHRELGEDLLHVLVRDAGGDDADLLLARLDAVELALARRLGHLGAAFLCGKALTAGERRHGDRVRDVLLVGDDLVRRGLEVAEVDERARVARARRETEHARHVELLRGLKRGLHHVVGLLGVGGLEHRHPGELREVAVVLLVLGGVHAGIIRGDHHHSARGAHVGERHQRVHRHVEPHVLHRRQRTRAGDRGTDRGLHRDLLVDGPFALHRILELRDVLEDLGGRRARVGARHDAPRLGGAAGNRFVRTQQFLSSHKSP